MKCYSCGKNLKDDEKVCPFCGADQGADEELVSKAMVGDQQAIADLYRRSYDNVYYTVKSMLRDEDTVQDLVQDTYVQAFRNLDSLNDPAHFQAWVRSIAHNRTVNYVKKKKPILFSEMTSPEEEEEEPVFVDENLDHMPEAVMDKEETARLIQEILNSLSDEQRITVGMYYYEQYSVREIAEIMGVSENTVKSRLNYGRKKIEISVRELEKKGTKLYGLAPIPFLLFLFRSQNAQAASPDDVGMLKRIYDLLQALADGDEAAQAAAMLGITAAAGSAVGGTAGNVAGTAANTAGLLLHGLGLKIGVGLAAVALLGGTTFYAANHIGKNAETVTTAVSTSATDFAQDETQTETETIQVITGTGVMQVYALTQEDFADTSTIAVWGNENLYRNEVEAITFLDSQDGMPGEEEIAAAGGSEATAPWDISQDGDGSVMAWAVDENSNGLYELYVAGTGEIHANADCSYLFAYFTNLKTLEFGGNFDTSQVKSMSAMFAGCSSLTETDFSGFDTSGVTTMASMFQGCHSLTALDLSGFNTAKVTDMSAMFADCFTLATLSLDAEGGGFYTGSVTDMSGMFRGCTAFTSLDLSGFDTSKATAMRGMFQGCAKLANLSVDSFNTSAVTDFAYMFESCTALTSLDVSHFVTSAATDLTGMFSGCSALTALDISGFDTARVRNMGSMFYGCSGLASLTLGNFDTANVVDMSYMFAGLGSGLQEELKEVTAEFDTSKANLLGWFE